MASSKRRPGKSHDAGFKLPPGITFEKKQIPDGMAYVFRHEDMGELGRLALREHGPAQLHIISEVVGDPQDPMTSKRREILEPITMQLTALMNQRSGGKGQVRDASTIPSSPAEPAGVVESKVLQCERCGVGVAHLIFADKAEDVGGLEDYARLMYPQVVTMNLPTWVIGPPIGGGPLQEPQANILKIWPTREPVRRLRPSEFDLEVGPLIRGHCKAR